MKTNKPSYSPSWVDRLTDWIESLAIPIWAFYLIVYLVAAISLNMASWINGVRPWGEISLFLLYNAIWQPLGLIVIHNTDLLAEKALDRFAPLVRGKEKALETIRYEMTTMPARTVGWIWAIAFTLLLISAIQDPEFVVLEMVDGYIHPASWVISALFGITSYSLAPLMIYHAIRQLNRVTKAYALIDDVSIFHQQPLYAFSGLTMRTALFLVGQVYITYLGEGIADPSSIEGLITLGLSAVIVPLSLLIVLLPLLGIHQRLSEAKLDALEENSFQVERTQGKLYAAVDKDKYDAIGGLDQALSSLYKVREQLKSVATWPWAPGALRNFMSAVLLPMLVWALQFALDKLFGA